VSSDAGTPPPSSGGKRTGGNTSMDPLIGRILLERYEVLRKIGSGGMGAVYVGRQLAVGREIALKVLRSDLLSNEHVRERFRREASIIGKLRHPNTIQLIDYGETDDGLAVMVCELLVGTVLSDQLKQHGPMPPLQAVETCRQVASSLAEAHALGMVHRDLKPANIFLVEVAGKTHAKVLDFGIARMLDEESTRITSTGQVFGTPRYMSPEQGTATGEADHRADLYSLGLILFECLVGQPPFVANTSIQYLSAHMTLPPPHLHDHMPSAPKELDQLIDSCLVKDRDQRIASADELERQLRRIVIGLETGEIPPHVPVDPTLPSGALRSASSLTGPKAAPKPNAGVNTLGATTAGDLRAPKKGISTGAIAAAAGLVFLVAAGGAFAWWRGQQPTTSQIDSPDAATAVLVEAVKLPDAAAVAIASTTDAIDAGAEGAAASPDAADPDLIPTSGAPDSGHAAVATGDPKKRRDAGVPRGSPSGFIGGVTGPRGMWIPTGKGDDGPVEMAKACKTGWSASGEAMLTLKPCGKGCAVIIDGSCAGRTPAVDVAAPAGNKSLTVVCGTQVVVDLVAKLRAGETTTLSCR